VKLHANSISCRDCPVRGNEVEKREGAHAPAGLIDAQERFARAMADLTRRCCRVSSTSVSGASHRV
jgi:hypothetical protein